MTSQHAASIILIASALLNWGGACTPNRADAIANNTEVSQRKTGGDVHVVSAAASPDGEHIATSYIVSGGGAAGYTYQVVNLRRRGEELDPEKDVILSASGAGHIGLAWESDERLSVTHSQAGRIHKQVAEWAGRRKIRVTYLPE